MRDQDTDDTRSHRNPGVLLCVGFLAEICQSSGEVLNTGRHEKVPVRCPCSRLAALHGAPVMMHQIRYSG